MVMGGYTEKELEQIRDDYMENIGWSATDGVIGTYKALGDAFQDYIAAVSDFEFKNGFKYAQMLKGE